MLYGTAIYLACSTKQRITSHRLLNQMEINIWRKWYICSQLGNNNDLLKREESFVQRSHNYGVWNYWEQKLRYCICYILLIDWHMIFGLEQEGGSLIAPMALAHPLNPIDNRSRNKRRNLWIGCFSSWWPWLPSRSSVLIFHILYTYIYIYIYAFLIWVLL